MSDPRAVKIRAEQSVERKNERDNASAGFKESIALGQIAEAIFSLRDEVQDLRIALETKR